MKKTFFVIFTLFTLQFFSQNVALTYSVSSASGVSQDLFNLPLGNSLFYAYYSQGLVLQKNDLNGVPVLIKKFPSSNISLRNMISNNGFLYLIGTSATGGTNSVSIPTIFIVDTINFNLQYTTTYNFSFPNIAWVNINDAKFLNSGNILMVGSINSYSTSSTVAWAMEVNPNANGIVVNTNTLTVGTSTANSFNSFSEISNSSIIFSGNYSNPYGFLAKASRSGGILTFNTLYETSIGGGVINSFSNPKKLLISTYLNGGSDFIMKVDTNLSLLSSISQAGIIRIGGNFYGSNQIKVANNKLYRLNSSKVLDILDTSLVSVSTKSYTSVDPMFFNSLNFNNSNVFMLGSTMYDIFALVKTDLSGSISCSNTLPFTNSVMQTNGGSTPFNSGVLLATQNSTSPSSQTATIIYTVTCGNITSLKENEDSGNQLLTFFNNEIIIKSNLAVETVDLFDLTGKLIRHFSYSNNETELKIKLTDFSTGMYILKTKDNSSAEHIHKLLVN